MGRVTQASSVHPGGGSTDRNPVLQHLDQVGNMGMSTLARGHPVLRSAAPRPGGEYEADGANMGGQVWNGPGMDGQSYST